MSRKQNILILFDGPHLAYSPTTIQLYDQLSPKHHVTIIAQNPDNYNGQRVSNRNVFYYPYYGVKSRHIYLALFKVMVFLNNTVKLFNTVNLDYRDYFFRFLFIKNKIKKGNFDRVICVDITNLFFCSVLNVTVDFVSLELCKNEHLLKIINKAIITCVIIQSKERYAHLFKHESIKTFIVQNAPVYFEIKSKSKRNGLIYSGAANDMFGFFHCLKYISKYPDEKMYLQGALLPKDREIVEKEFPDLLSGKRLIINDTYLDNNAIANYLSDFEIGFCFYNFEHPYVKANYFNYASAPSGKMFKYLAAGVPVVSSNIEGFKFVNEFQCGILVDNPNEETIRAAILKIRSNYASYVENAMTAAQHFSFDAALAPYLKFIEE